MFVFFFVWKTQVTCKGKKQVRPQSHMLRSASVIGNTFMSNFIAITNEQYMLQNSRRSAVNTIVICFRSQNSPAGYSHVFAFCSGSFFCWTCGIVQKGVTVLYDFRRLQRWVQYLKITFILFELHEQSAICHLCSFFTSLHAGYDAIWSGKKTLKYNKVELFSV